jgi:AraC-like DNA-binding protein
MIEDAIAHVGPKRLAALIRLLSELAGRADWREIAGAPLPYESSLRDTRRLRTLQEYLEQRYDESLPEERIAGELGLTRTSFCRWIRAVTGRTFSDILNDHRVARATILLRNTDRPVSAIALDCGYQSLSHFYREFGKRHRLNPSDFRPDGARGRREELGENDG